MFKSKADLIEALLIAVAIISIAFSLSIWWLDGAWHYGAMPTEGVIRVSAFGLGGILALFVGRKLR